MYVNNDIHGKYNVINSDLNSGITNLNTDITFDFIFINSGEGFGKWNDLNKLIEKINKNTVILIEGIKNDERIKLYWDYLRSLDTVKVSMDLYDFGLLIFDEKLYKQHYIVAY